MNTMTAPTKEGHLVLGSSEDALTVCVLDDEQGMVEMFVECVSACAAPSTRTGFDGRCRARSSVVSTQAAPPSEMTQQSSM